MSVNVGSATGYLDLDISGFLTSLQTAQAQADAQTKSMATSIGKNISSIGKNIETVGSSLTKNLTVPLAGITAVGLKVATDFEKAMSEVKAISGATGEDFEALKEKAVELGADTAFSSTEVAAGMTEMAKAGWSSEQIIAGMSGVLAAAAASGEGLASVSTIVADAITGFGLEASDSTRIADLLTQAANSGTIGINDLGESFKYVAPVAGALGISVEDATTALSAMSMAGIKGSQAGTSLRTLLTNIVRPTDNMASAMINLGLATTDAEGNFVSLVSNADGSFKSLDELIATMRTGMSGMTEEQKASTAAALAGKEGMSGLLSIMNLTQEEYDALGLSMDNSNGIAEKTASIMQDNLQSKVEQLGGALESLAIKLSEHVLPYLTEFVEWLTKLVDKFIELDPETQKSIIKFGALAAAAGPVVLIVGKLVSGFGGFISAITGIPAAIGGVKLAFTAVTTALANLKEGIVLAKAGFPALAAEASPLGAAIGGITAPIAAVIAAIALLVAAFISLWNNNEEFRNNIIAIWEKIKASFEKLASGIVERLNKLGFDFENIAEVLSAVWTGFCDLLAPYFEGVFNNIAIILETAVNVILGVIDFFIALFTGDWEGCWNAIKSIFESVWNGMKAWFSNILNVITGVLDVALGWFGTSWSECWNGIKTFFETIWNGIVSWFTSVINGIVTFFTDAWNGISTFFSELWTGISTFVTTAWETIKNIIQVGIMFIVELFKAAFNLITLPFQFIWQNCKDVIIAVWDAIKTKIQATVDIVKTKIETVFNFIKAVVSTVWNAIKTTISTVWDNIKTKVTNVVDKIKEKISNVFEKIKTKISNVWNTIKTKVSNAVENIKTKITDTFDTVKTKVKEKFDDIKAKITGPIEDAKTKITTTLGTIKTKFSEKIDEIKSKVKEKFDEVKSKITQPIEDAKTKISQAIESIKSKFNFNWELPKLKLPHFKITGEFSLNPPSVPSLSIEWYKKAMNNGMIMNAATIFGYNSKTGKFMAGGEAGSETIVGTNSLMSMIKQAVYDSIRPVIEATNQIARASAELGYVTYNGFVKQAQALEKVVKSSADNSGGDTFIFQSPKAIDEIEAAKQMKRAKRQLAEGF